MTIRVKKLDLSRCQSSKAIIDPEVIVHQDRRFRLYNKIDCWPNMHFAACEEFVYIAALAWDGFETKV